MKHLLARAHRNLVERFARSRLFVGLDFDGTLAPIMLDPDAVTLGGRMRGLLGQVAALYPTTVISGRSRRDVAARLRGLPLYEIVGNHGLEPGGKKHDHVRTRQVARWINRLHRDLDGCKGVSIEDKGLSVAVHYRRSRAKKSALAAITASVAGLGPVRALGGKQVVNLLPAGAPDKGRALCDLVSRARCDTAIYLGDDDTDEDVFALDSALGSARPAPGRLRLLTVRVGSHARSRAAYYVRHRGEVEILLRTLRDVRAGTRS